MRSTGLADTKPSFGVKLARSCLRSMHWAEEDLRTEVAISTSATGTNDPLTSTRNAESANHQAKIQRFWQASDENSHRQIGFVLSNGQSVCLRRSFTGCVRCSVRAAAFTCGLCRSGSGIATPDAVSGSTACVRNATLNFGMHSAVQCTVVKQ